MEFTKDSAIVKSYILLIEKELRTLGDVPELLNLREVVAEALGLEEN